MKVHSWVLHSKDAYVQWALDHLGNSNTYQKVSCTLAKTVRNKVNKIKKSNIFIQNEFSPSVQKKHFLALDTEKPKPKTEVWNWETGSNAKTASNCQYLISKSPSPITAKAPSSFTRNKAGNHCSYITNQEYIRKQRWTSFAMSRNLSKVDARHKARSTQSSLWTDIQRIQRTIVETLDLPTQKGRTPRSVYLQMTKSQDQEDYSTFIYVYDPMKEHLKSENSSVKKHIAKCRNKD